MTPNTDPTGVYYDAESGVFISVTSRENNTIAIESIESTDNDDEPVVYDSVESFHEEEPDLMPVPESAIENPVQVAEDVYAEGFETLLNQSVDDVAILYADRHTKIVEREP